MTDKARLRRRLRAARDALTGAEHAARSRALCGELLALPCVRGATLLAGYQAFGSEADVAQALSAACEAGAQLALPRVEGSRLLSLRAWVPGEPLVANRWGIPEPQAHAPRVALEAVSTVLVPVLGLDARGHRLGYGGGYYDSLLPQLPQALRVGVAFELQLVDTLQAEPHDARLDFIVTETGARAVSD